MFTIDAYVQAAKNGICPSYCFYGEFCSLVFVLELVNEYCCFISVLKCNRHIPFQLIGSMMISVFVGSLSSVMCILDIRRDSIYSTFYEILFSL